MATSQHQKYSSPRKRSIYIALIDVYVAALVYIPPPDFTWLLPPPFIHLFFSANTLSCWWGTQGHQVQAGSPCTGRASARFSQAACVLSPPLWERLEVLSYLTQPSVKSSPEHFNPGRKRDVSVTRAGTRCGAARLLGTLSRVQG